MIEPADAISAVADQINRQTGVRAFDYVPDDANPPFVFVHPTAMGDETYDSAFRLDLEVVVFVAKAVDRTGQRELYKFMSRTDTKSIWSAFDADPSFGISGLASTPGEFRGLGIDEVAAYSYYGGAWALTVTI